MLPVKSSSSSRHFVVIPPDNFIDEVFLPKYFVQNNLHIVADVPIKMDVDRGGFAHNLANGKKPLVKPIQVILFLPDVAIHYFFADGVIFGFERCFAAIAEKYFLRIVRAAGERWVN